MFRMAKIVSYNKSLLIEVCQICFRRCGKMWHTLPIAHCLLTFVWLVFPFLLSAQYRLQIKPVDKDSVFIYSTLRLQSNFKNEVLAKEYIANLPGLLQSKGYP